MEWETTNPDLIIMKRLFFLCGVLLFAVASCERGDDFSKSDLTGLWKMNPSSGLAYTPTLSFNMEGEYILTDFVRYTPVDGIVFSEYTVTGEYLFEDSKITFTTAIASFPDNQSGTAYPYVTGNPIGSAYCTWLDNSGQIGSREGDAIISTTYTPKVWEVIELTGSTLKVLVAPGSVVVYKK